MICPNCGYNEYKTIETGDNVLNDEGVMYSLLVEMERETYWQDWNSRTATLYACPSCKKAFIEEAWK